MSFKDCILGRIADGTIGKDKKGFLPEAKARALVMEYDNLVARYTESMGDEAAAHAAAEHFVAIKSAIINKKIENDLTHFLVQKRVDEQLKARAAVIGADREDAKTAKFLFGNPYARSVREFLQETFIRHESLKRQFHAMIPDIIEQFRSKKAGFEQDIAGFVDVVREMGGASTGNKEAAMYGKAVREVFDTAHTMFDEAGGILGKIENYFPQSHTPELVARSSFADWKSFIKPLLDREKMVNPETALPFDDRDLDLALKSAYDSIRTNGLIDVAQKAKEGKQRMGGVGDISMRQSSSRFLHFKDVDSFLEYNNRFGVGDAGLFHAVMGHIDGMARDIAVLQKMGPKPNALFKNMELHLQAEQAGKIGQNVAAGMYKTLIGANSFGGPMHPAYKAMSGYLNLARSSKLGSAVVSALSDVFFLGYAAKMNGLPVVKVIGRYYKNFNPASEVDRRVMRRHLFVANAASGQSLQGARFADDIGRGGWTGFLAGVTNRASGLATMTDIGKGAIGMELAGNLAEYRTLKTAFKDIDPAMRKAAEGHGIDAKDWDRMLASEPTTFGQDVDFMFPEDIARLGEDGADVATKFSDWFTEMANLALNEPGLLTRTITSGAFTGADVSPGTATRLLFGNIFFAKSFPISIMINHLTPALREAAQGRGRRLAGLAIGSTVFGAAAMQARQIVQGKDPRDMTEPSFWPAAMLQGGGLGLFGDFMFGEYNRFGNSPAASLAGPTVGLAESLMKLGDLDSLGTDKKWDRVPADLWKIVNREIPVARLWYTRLFVERMIMDQVESMLDPSYDSRMRKIESRMQKKNGQGFWWTPGEVAPERGPDLTTTAGGQ